MTPSIVELKRGADVGRIVVDVLVENYEDRLRARPGGALGLVQYVYRTQLGRMTAFLMHVMVVGLSGCVAPMRGYENPWLRAKYETEFKERTLDPIEGFWRSDNEFVEGVGVTYRTDPTANDGFPFAVRAITVRPKRPLPYAPDFTRIQMRLKPGNEPGMYHGQGLMVRGAHHYWNDVTVRLLDPTTAETTIHTSEPVLGGKTQRAYLVGPTHIVQSRLEAAARRKPDSEVLPTNSSGSGCLVGPSLVATNHHVVKNAERIRCFIADAPVNARIIASDPDTDLALLRLEVDTPLEIVPLALVDSASVRQGRRVFGMGYQLTGVVGTKLSVQEGTISALTGFEGRGSQYQIAMNVHPGSSGGPLLGERGCLLGIVTSKLGLGYLLITGDIPQGMAFAVKADIVRTLAASAGVLDQLTLMCDERQEMNLEEITDQLAPAVVRIDVAR